MATRKRVLRDLEAEAAERRGDARVSADALRGIPIFPDDPPTEGQVPTYRDADKAFRYEAPAGGGGTKTLHAIPFATAAESATVETMLPLPSACIGESGDMGTVTGIRFKVFLGTAGVTGTMTVKLYADSASNFPSETEIASVDITTELEDDDVTIVGWVPGTDNFLRAKITAIHSGTAAKNVACVFYYEVTIHA